MNGMPAGRYGCPEGRGKYEIHGGGLGDWGKHCGGEPEDEPEQMDGRLGILKLAARDAKEPEVLLIRVTAHANVLSGDNYFISADYMGAARKRLEEAYGCPVMMVQGAAGDIRPRYHQDNMEYVEIHCWEMARKGFSQEYRQKYVPQSRRALEQMAEDMFRSVDAVYASLVLMPLERVEIRSSFCQFAADVPDMERAEEIAEEAEREGEIDGRMWLKEVKRLLDEGIQKQYADIEIQYLFVNQAVSAVFPMRPCAGSPLIFGRRQRHRFCFSTAIPTDAAAICPPQKSMIRRIRGAVVQPGIFSLSWPGHAFKQGHGRENGRAGGGGLEEEQIIKHPKNQEYQ